MAEKQLICEINSRFHSGTSRPGPAVMERLGSHEALFFRTVAVPDVTDGGAIVKGVGGFIMRLSTGCYEQEGCRESRK